MTSAAAGAFALSQEEEYSHVHMVHRNECSDIWSSPSAALHPFSALTRAELGCNMALHCCVEYMHVTILEPFSLHNTPNDIHLHDAQVPHKCVCRQAPACYVGCGCSVNGSGFSLHVYIHLASLHADVQRATAAPV